MRYVSRWASSLPLLWLSLSGCTTELRINGKPVEISAVVFEVNPPNAKVASSSRLKVRFRSLDGMATGKLETKLEDPTELFEIDHNNCQALKSDQTCEIMVSFNSDECQVGATSEPEARLVIESENAGLAIAELVGNCSAPSQVITARR